MKNILIFTGYFLPHLGGVERYTDKLVRELNNIGIKVTVVCCNHSELPFYDKISDNLSIYRIPIYNLFKERYPIIKKNSDYRNVLKALLTENFDFVICNTRFYLTTLLGLNFAKKRNIPSLVIEHGSNHFTINNKILDYMGAIYEHILTFFIKRKTSNFFGVSLKCNEWLKHFGIEANGVFYNSIDSHVYEEFKEKKFSSYINLGDKIIISFAGRIIKEKGVEILLEAFDDLQKKYDNIVLFIAGDGPILNDLKKKYQSENIVFTGKIDYEEIMSLYNITDIFVHPSMFPEGLPTTILEAGLMNCAVVATNRGGTAEVIIDDRYGIIVEENKESLKTNIEKLILDNTKCTQLAENLHKRIVENFTWKKTAAIVKEEMERIIDAR